MSNALSIAAVTRTLRTLLEGVATIDFSALPNDTRPSAQIEVTTLPPDRVRLPDASRNRLNLFLYQTDISAAWRNADLPQRVRPGESGSPPLALNLFYLLTVYAENDSDLVGQVLLGTAMRILHDHAVLGRDEIRSALAMSELDTQVERVRLTPQPMSLDEMSKLWTGLQSEYRLSAAYQAAVVLIESERPLRAALPVLRRGGEDRGAFVASAPAPTLDRVKEIVDPSLAVPLPHGKPAAELGDVIVLRGTHFGQDPTTARFRHHRFDEPLVRPLAARTDTEVQVALPPVSEAGVAAAWPAGFYTIELVVQRPSLPSWTTNQVPFGLAATITSLDPPSQSVGAQPFDLTVECTPQVRAEQRVVLLLGDREIAPTSVATPADPDAATTLVFPVDRFAEGRYVVRVRIDGVDSLPVDFAARPPQFDATQMVTITP